MSLYHCLSDSDQYQLGTLSHMINMKATGYQQLPEWPETAPDPSARNVEVVMPWTEKTTLIQKKSRPEKSFSLFAPPLVCRLPTDPIPYHRHPRPIPQR